MKLSLSKKLGWIQVRGGRILRVAKPHAVPTSGWSAFSANYDKDLLGRMKPEQRFHGEKWVYTNENDLAIEILYAKTSMVAGHSYLSGPAIQLNRYTPIEDGWFREASGQLVEIPVPNADQFASPQHFIEHVIGTLMAVKYGEADLGAFEYQAKDDAEAELVARYLAEMWSYRRTDEAVSKAHLLGGIHGGKTHVNVHFQPPEHADGFAATPFQVGLVLGTLRTAPKTLDAPQASSPS